MTKLIRPLLPALCGLGLLISLPDDTSAQCLMCVAMPERPRGLCIPTEAGATGCTFALDGYCRLVGEECPADVLLSVPEEDRLVVPTDDGNVMAVRLEGNTFGTWACNGREIRTGYRDLGNGVVVEVAPIDLGAYRSRYNSRVLQQVLGTRSNPDGE